MADLVQTDTSVVKGANALEETRYDFGETCLAGDQVYLHTDSKWYKALNDTAAHAGQGGWGAALNGGAINQAARVQTGGRINPGATVAVGQIYCVSPNAGKWAPYADVASTKFVTISGIGVTTSLIEIIGEVTGIQKA